MEYKYVVVLFDGPMGDYDHVIGVYDDKAIADEIAKELEFASVESVPYHKA